MVEHPVLLISPGHQRAVFAMPAQLPRSVACRPTMRASQIAPADHLFREGQLLAWGVPATGVLVGAAANLFDRALGFDHITLGPAVEQRLQTDDGFPARDIWLLRLRTLLGRAHGDAAAYAPFRDRYRDLARTLGFEGHTAWAEEMP